MLPLLETILTGWNKTEPETSSEVKGEKLKTAVIP